MVALVTMGAMASAGVGPASHILTVGFGSGTSGDVWGYMGPEFATLIEGTPFGSFDDPDLLYVITWSEDSSEIETVYSRVNNKIFTFPDYGGVTIDTSTFLYIPAGSTLAPIYANTVAYPMGSVLPNTVGAQLIYTVT